VSSKEVAMMSNPPRAPNPGASIAAVAIVTDREITQPSQPGHGAGVGRSFWSGRRFRRGAPRHETPPARVVIGEWLVLFRQRHGQTLARPEPQAGALIKADR
jgi:hypothetical protein